jgi:hypothetical protein
VDSQIRMQFRELFPAQATVASSGYSARTSSGGAMARRVVLPVVM